MYFVFKFLCRYLLISLFLFLSTNVFAAPGDAAPTTRVMNQPPGQRDFTADEVNQVKEMLLSTPLKPYSLNLYGFLQGNVNFADTTRNNIPDFTMTHGRLGVFVVEKNWSGKFEMEFNGNQPQREFPDLDHPPRFLRQSANNTVSIRQAQISFDFLRFILHYDRVGKNKFFKTTATDAAATYPAKAVAENAAVDIEKQEPQSASALSDTLHRDTSFVSRVSLGGIRVNGASAISTDATYSPSGFGRQDGIYFLENAAYNENLIGSFGLGMFNNLSTTTVGKLGTFQGWGAYPGTSSNFLGVLGVTSPTFQKAYVFTTNWTNNFTKDRYLNFVLYYGFQKNAAVTTNSNGFATTTRDAQHFETSLTYNDIEMFGDEALVSGNGIAAWFETEYGSHQTKTGAAEVDIPFGDLQDGYTSVLAGIGFGGDTRRYFTNLLFNADRLLYATSAAFVYAYFPNKNYSPNYNATQLAAQIGYGYKTLEINLVGSFAFSPEKTFAKFSITEPVSSSGINQYHQTNIYLSATLYF